MCARATCCASVALATNSACVRVRPVWRAALFRPVPIVGRPTRADAAEAKVIKNIARRALLSSITPRMAASRAAARDTSARRHQPGEVMYTAWGQTRYK